MTDSKWRVEHSIEETGAEYKSEDGSIYRPIRHLLVAFYDGKTVAEHEAGSLISCLSSVLEQLQHLKKATEQMSFKYLTEDAKNLFNGLHE